MKPVFGKRERDEIRDVGDATTVSRIDKDAGDVGNANTNMVTKEQAEEMALQAATRATDIALAKKTENESTGGGLGLDSKFVKQLQETVSVFNALKDFSANPLQKAIEGEVGSMAAGVVKRAFLPQQEPQKKDFIDQLLNSQFAASIGASLGQRGPELVNSLTQNFGRERVDGWISGAVGKGGGIGGMPGASPPGIFPGQTKQQSDMEMVLDLDPNNPEHVAAYAASQGGMSVDTARRVLMMHQDDFIKQIETRGMDATRYKLKRNQSQNQETARQETSGNIQDIRNVHSGNVQEYRGPPPRVNEDLIVNTPVTEDKRWEKEDVTQKGVDNGNIETRNTELHPEMERVDNRAKPKRVEPVVDDSNLGNENAGEIVNYLKSLNDYVGGLKDEMFNLRHELDVLKKDRMTPEDMLNIERKEEKDNNIKNINNHAATVRSMKTIKKGYSFVKKEE